MKRKSRSIPYHMGPSTETVQTDRYVNEKFAFIESRTVTDYPGRTIKGSQVTDSEGHPWRRRKHRSSSDVGGPFFSMKQDVRFNPVNVRFTSRTGAPFQGRVTNATRSGPCCPYAQIGQGSYGFPPASYSSEGQLDTLGATAVSLAKPTNSVANLSTFLGELIRDRVPPIPVVQTWEKIARDSRQAGSDYLAVQFGWKPMVKDVNTFLGAVAHAADILEQYERDAGRPVRRRWNFPTTTESSVSQFPINDWADFTPANTADYATFAGTLTRVRVTERRRWFSGAFTYHLPRDYDSREAMSRYALLAKKVLGLSLTPENIWEITPWSWAVDWFSNTGDVISNVTSWANDDLVMRYGYLMENTIVTDTYSRSPSPFKTGAGTGSISLITNVKQRRPANPFGFGVTWDGLSPYQLSIAAALGLSRSPAGLTH